LTLVDKKRIIGKMKSRGGGEAQGVSDPKKDKLSAYVCMLV
jgi:hypothetical protein